MEHTFASGLERPNCVFAVDVDEDSDIDVLVAVQGDEEVHWLENFVASDDGFASHAIDVASVAPRSVFGVDMDGDGDVDVLASSYEDNTVAWYENDGSESFAKRIVSTSPWGRGLVTGVSVGWTGGCVSMVEFSRRDGTTQRFGADVPDAFSTVDPPIDPNSEYVSYIGQYVWDGDPSLCTSSYFGHAVFLVIRNIYTGTARPWTGSATGGFDENSPVFDEEREWPNQIVGLVVAGDGDDETLDVFQGVLDNTDGVVYKIFCP